MVNYIPNKKDIIYLDFTPTKGHEQSGVRPALVISDKVFNQFTGMVVVVPITTNTKDFPTHYELKSSKKIKGSVLCEHIRSIDYRKRNVKLVEKCSKTDLDNVLDLVKSFFEN